MLGKMMVVMVVAFLGVGLLVPSGYAQDGNTAVTNAELNVRSGPGIEHSLISTLPYNTVVGLEGRNGAGDWVLINAPVRGWVYGPYLSGANISALPVVEGQVEAGTVEVGEGQLSATTSTVLNVRTGPSINNSRITTLAFNTPLVVEGRNAAGTWALVHTADETVRGWVSATFLRLPAGARLSTLPISTETVAALTTASTTTGPGSAIPPASANASVADMLARLNATPILYNFSVPRLQQIHQAGRNRGINRQVFTKVGDSITANLPFLTGFGTGNYNLGGYGNLQNVINFFSVSPRAGVANSFVNPSVAAVTGYNSALILDPIWSDPSLCQASESSLDCEYRLVRPAVSIIMLGAIDVQFFTLEQYTSTMRQVIEKSVNQGVIPMLNTFAVSDDYVYWEKSLRFNMILLDLAQQYGTPVINLWLATVPLPAHGLDTDKVHLSQGNNPYAFVNNDEHRFGTTMRNLVTLQGLEILVNNVLSQ